MHHALVDSIKSLLEQERAQPRLIAIDGPAGAGKTTLADEIRYALGFGEIIHCDDLYNGWQDALTSTFERHVHEWILEPLQNGLLPRYQKFDWSTDHYREQVQLPATPLVILEGVGAAIPKVAEFADLSIWIDIPAAIGLERVLLRDGSGIREHMLDWIEIQDAFFARHQNRENCDVHLSYGAPA